MTTIFNQNQLPIRIMIDMETPATCAGAGILTLGACTFGLPFGQPRQTFYEKASLASNESAGRVISKATLQWWSADERTAARNEVFSGTDTITMLLSKFEAWAINAFCINEGRAGLSERIELWSRGAGFDCEILQDAFMEIFGYYPFDFRKHMCQRTIERLMPQNLKVLIGANSFPHHALHDAINQADLIDVALRNIKWQGVY